jgi:predicted pyridoxine 5'-phosphate oxidase superfamily flavin-nucleotide-binding protein
MNRHEFIDAAPFAILATTGADGLDASAQGDPGGFVRLLGNNTLPLRASR